MRYSKAKNLKIGDYVDLKHNHGEVRITDKQRQPTFLGRFLFQGYTSDYKRYMFTHKDVKNIVENPQGAKAWVNISKLSTSELLDALVLRNGVKEEYAEPHQDFTLTICGPARVLIVTD